MRWHLGQGPVRRARPQDRLSDPGKACSPGRVIIIIMYPRGAPEMARPTIRKTNPIWMKSPQIVKLDDSPVRPNLIRRANHYRGGEDNMAANPFSRGSCPGRARPPHRGSFKGAMPNGADAQRGRRMPYPRAPERRSRRRQSASPAAPVSIAITGSGSSKRTL
jgi:hypothetical protein